MTTNGRDAHGGCMIDEWTLEYQVGHTWFPARYVVGERVHAKLKRLRWSRDGYTQPARTDDDGRLLGPDTTESLRAEIRQKQDEIAARGGGLHELVGQWPGDEAEPDGKPSTMPATFDDGGDYDCDRCNDSGQYFRVHSDGRIGCIHTCPCDAGMGQIKALSEMVDDEPQYEVMTLDGAMPDLQEAYDYCDHVILGGQPEPERGPDPHIRAQLVDGLPGPWTKGESYREWHMHIACYYRATIELHRPDASAIGFIEMRAVWNEWREVPDTRVRTDSADGEDYVMQCAELLRPKIEATRELVARLRGDECQS